MFLCPCSRGLVSESWGLVTVVLLLTGTGRPLGCFCKTGFPQWSSNSCLVGSLLYVSLFPRNSGACPCGCPVNVRWLRPLRSLTPFRLLKRQGKGAQRARPCWHHFLPEKEGPSEARLPCGTSPVSSPVWFPPMALTTVAG